MLISAFLAILMLVGAFSAFAGENSNDFGVSTDITAFEEVKDDSLPIEELNKYYEMLYSFGYMEIIGRMLDTQDAGDIIGGVAIVRDWVLSLEGQLPERYYAYAHDQWVSHIPSKETQANYPEHLQWERLHNKYSDAPDFEFILYIFDDDGIPTDYIVVFGKDIPEVSPFELELTTINKQAINESRSLDSMTEEDYEEGPKSNCTPRCTDWGSWKPNKSWCYRNCNKCGSRETIGHAVSRQYRLTDTRHEVRCSRCNYLHDTLLHTYPSWTLTPTAHNRRCSGNPCNQLDPASGTHVWIGSPQVCRVCGWRP